MEAAEKARITKRLRELGLWEDAQPFLDETRQGLKREGASRQEAVAGAWEAVAERYADQLVESPSEVEPDPPADVLQELDELAASSLDTELDLMTDVRWAYFHLGDRKARPVDAPSLGAWHLLEWARANKARFFDRALKVMITKLPQPSASEPQTNEQYLPLSKEEQVRVDALNRRIEAVKAAREKGTPVPPLPDTTFQCARCGVTLAIPGFSGYFGDDEKPYIVDRGAEAADDKSGG